MCEDFEKDPGRAAGAIFIIIATVLSVLSGLILLLVTK